MYEDTLDIETVIDLEPMEDPTRYSIVEWSASSRESVLLLSGDGDHLKIDIGTEFLRDTPRGHFEMLQQDFSQSYIGGFRAGDTLVVRMRITGGSDIHGCVTLDQPVLLAHIFPGRHAHICSAEEAMVEYNRVRE